MAEKNSSTRRGFATIWDGLIYRQVPHEEAERLEKEDKCQNLSSRMHSATDLKFRKDFTGYKTREMRAEASPQPVAIPAVEKTVKPAVEKPAKKADDLTPGNWMKFRKAAAEKLGKPTNKTTKAQTVKYMEKHLGLKKT